MACRRASLAALPTALAVLMAAPMPGAPQVIGPCDGDCPRFSSTASLTFRISEGIGSGDAIAVLPAATDADQDDDQIAYALWDRDDPVENGDRDETGFGDGDAAAFSIGEDVVSGENNERIRTLTLHTGFGHDYDYESEPPKRSYRFRMVACDNNYNRAYVDVTVHIDNVNEDLGRPDAPQVEGVSPSKLVVRWTAPSNTGPPITDYDLQYRKRGATDAWRSWSHGGAQTNAVITGLQAGTQYEAQVLARNGEGVSAWSPSGIGSTLTAGNNPPVFLDASPAARSVAENTPANRNVGRPVRAEGESTLTYSLGGADAASFDFVSSSGQIRTKAGVTYDYEARPFYTVTVTATDQNPDSSDATIAVDISLDDVDEPPLRPAAPVVATSRGGDTILDVTWSAPDNTGRPAVDDYDLRYRRIAGAGQNCRNWCAWAHTGSTTATSIVDLESGTRYEVQVLARSHEGESPWSPSGSGWTNTQGNTIPSFDDGASTTRSVAENTAAGQPVGAPVAATDGDTNDTVTYLLEGVDARFFSIDAGTGQIRTRSGVTYDHEARDTYSVAVKATDSSHVGASIAVTIMIEDVDEPPNPPARPTVRGRSTRSLSVSWRAPSNAGRPEIESYDLQYREGTSGDWLDGPQDVSETSAIIQDATPALEPGTPYQVQVRATNDEGDGPWSPPGSGRTLAPPTFPAGPLTRSFRETTGAAEPASRNIGAPVRATFSGGTLTYTLEGGDAGSFDIDDETGQIKTQAGAAYNYEAEGPDHAYAVTVRARDASDTSAAVAVTIHITNATERPLAPGTPVVDSATTDSLTVRWTAPDNTGRPDIESYDVQYRKGTSGGWRNGPQDVTGPPATIPDLDPETRYQVQVRATNADGNGPYSPPGAGWTSGAGPVSNSPPTFPAGPLTRSFPENTPPNRAIGEPVTATDTDDGDTLSYSLHGADAPSFNIDFNTGQIRTKSGVPYESGDTFSVTVRATDSSNAAASIVVAITVTDADASLRLRGGGDDGRLPRNSAPVFADSATLASTPVSRSFPENTPPGVNVGAPVTATDADGDPLTYSLKGPDATSFDIEPQTGQLKTKAGVTYDYETRASYSVIVKVEDDGGASSTIEVTIYVTDAAEPPTTPEAPTVTAPEGSSTSLLAVWTAPALQGGPPLTDYDVEYRQGDSGNWSDWPHDGTGTATTITGLAPHTGYQVRVLARNDEGDSDWSPPGSGRTNKTAPAFADAEAARSFPENTPPGEAIGAPVTATDPDGDPLTYTLGGTDAASFDIESESGQIRTRAGVTYDYETKDAYSVTVTASDSSHASGTVAVTIHVTNVAEKPAAPDAPTVRAPEGSSTSLLVNWTAPDLNGGPPITDYDVAYRQVDGGDWIPWPHDGIGASAAMTGRRPLGDAQVRVPASIGTSTTITGLRPHTDYEVRVRAFNGELHSDWSPPGRGRTNNSAPIFAGPTDSRSFPENTPPGETVGAPVTATDPDGDPLTYTLGGTDAGSFDINAESGQIETRAGVSYDYEVQSSYAVTVQAADPLGASSTIGVTIHVTDAAEPPATPAAPAVSAPDGTNTSLLVTWTAPDLNGGPPLTDYDVQYRQGATGDWVDWQHDGIATTTTLTGLAEGAAYQVRVRALNDEAASDWSPPGSGRTNATMDRWLGRFGRSVAQQMMHGVEERLASPCRTGLQGTLAGRGFGGDRHLAAHGAGNRWAARDGSGDPLPRWAGGLEAEGSTARGRTLLAATDFELGSETADGMACVWGRGAYSSFHGRDGPWSLDGNVSTGTLGADYARGPWTVGLALAHSKGEGRSRQDDVEAALTGLYPYAGYRVTERFSVWGLGGIGRGGLTVTPAGGLSVRADLGLLMVAAGARSLLVTAASGMNVALETDGFWARTASDDAPGLLASQADAKGLRFGLESSYRMALKNGGRLTPKVEAGLRYDGGGAETGLGVDVGGGLLWSAPLPGVSAEIVIRRVLMHEATGFSDWSVSGLVRYDPNPFSERGVSLAFRSAIGPPSLDGVNALLDRETAAGLASSDTSHGGQLTAEAAYGFPILGGRFTGAPWVGAGLLGRGRNYRIGYRISPASLSSSHMRVGIEGMRRENGGGRAETEHAIGVRLGLGW